MIIPPYAGVRLVEYDDHIALTPVTFSREFIGLGKIKASEVDFSSEEARDALALAGGRDSDLWVIVQWERFADGSERPVNLEYVAGATEKEARQAFQRMKEFLTLSKDDLEALSKCFKVPQEDRDYIANRFVEKPPDRRESRTQYDLYQARLKVLAGMQPKTVTLMERAYATDDPVERARIEFEAVSAFYAEMAHYWPPLLVKEWQTTNPISAKYMREFIEVLDRRKREIDPIDHEIVLNWLRRNYHLSTAEELSDAIFENTGERLTAEALKKRRQRIGLNSDRPPGPRPKSEQ